LELATFSVFLNGDKDLAGGKLKRVLGTFPFTLLHGFTTHLASLIRYHPPMIRIEIDRKALEKAIGLTNSKQIPYATALALTRIAKDAQQSVRASMPSRFTLRRNWIVKGIRITPATKTKLESVVYSIDPFMARHEFGGIKMGKPGGGDFKGSDVAERKSGRNYSQIGGRVAVPTNKVLRSKSEIIRKSELPSGLGKKAFVIGNKSDTQLLARRFSRGKRAGLQILYVLKKATRIEKRFGMGDTVMKVVQRRFGATFSQALQEALATAKP
jgi:hypothetical protein